MVTSARSGRREAGSGRRGRPRRAAPIPADRFPNLIAVAEHFHYADNDQSFELLTDLFVNGLAQRASTGR